MQGFALQGGENGVNKERKKPEKQVLHSGTEIFIDLVN